MGVGALSPSSVLATPIQVNPQVKTDILASSPQIAQNAEKVAAKSQTDTITISPQALKMADDKNVNAKELADKEKDTEAARLKKEKDTEAARLEKDKAESFRNSAQRNAVNAYVSMNSGG